MKRKILVSISGGETSLYMAYWMIKHLSRICELIFVFANTGEENEETLIFLDKCDKYFNLNTIWVEARHKDDNGNPYSKKGWEVKHRVVNFETASRNGEPFEEMISLLGIANSNTPMCSVQLKRRAIESYAKSIGWDDYYTAIGIRSDEGDRINLIQMKERQLLYPLASNKWGISMTKPKINFWWSQQPFRLVLKHYQGNCKWCWKKSEKKHYKLAQEDEENFNFPLRMEKKYESFIPPSRLESLISRGETPNFPVTFFRKHKSSIQIIAESKLKNNIIIPDEAREYNEDGDLFENNDTESCDIFANCGDEEKTDILFNEERKNN